MKTEIEKHHACRAAVEYRKQFDTFAEAWNACPRGDWMLWIAAKAGVSNRTLTLAKGLCAETVIHLMKDERSVKAVRVAIAYGRGNATDEELTAAADAAADVAAAADPADAVAAYAAAAAAYAAYVDAAAAYVPAAYAAAAADDAAAAAAYVDAVAASAADAYAAAYAAARKENQLQTANICRKVLTNEIMKLI